MKIWIPDMYFESHRDEARQVDLIAALQKQEISLPVVPTADCNFFLCGSVYKHDETNDAHFKYPHVPVIQYCWDIYPFQVDSNPDLWIPYFERLREAVEIWVPSQCTTLRVRHYSGRKSVVIKAGIKPWRDIISVQGDYVVDVMRKYSDPNKHAVKEACDKLGLLCIEPSCQLPWDEYSRLIAGARMLVSAYYEASTGGLSLLEGYWLGKRVLLNSSPRNGGRDYFPGLEAHFVENQYIEKDLPVAIQMLFSLPPREDVEEGQKWVEENYSDATFAQRIANRLREIQCLPPGKH